MEGQASAQPERTYDVALSFAGEQRGYVEEVARRLHDRGIATFYDDFEKVPLWGKDPVEELAGIYANQSGYVIVFISNEWVTKVWPRHERRVVLTRAIQQQGDYILPVRFDDTPVPGWPNIPFYVEAKNHPPAELATMIAQKLGITPSEGKASHVPPPRMTSLAGDAVFNYSNHDGRYVIGRGMLEFETEWSKASNTSIHVYNDPPSINGIALAPRECRTISRIVNAESFDYTSRSRTPHLGQIVLFRNVQGFYAAAQVLAIKDDSRGDDCDELRFHYIIQPDGSGNFTELSATE